MKLTCESELASRAVNMLAPNEVIKLTTNEVREAIVQKIPEFYEIISQTGGTAPTLKGDLKTFNGDLMGT